MTELQRTEFSMMKEVLENFLVIWKLSLNLHKKKDNRYKYF